MTAAYCKIEIGQGETWRMGLRLRNPVDPDTGSGGGPIDLTGYSVRMQIRESITSPAPLYALTSEVGGGITVDGPEGVLRILIADDETASWVWRYGLYDLEIESASGETTRLLRGEVEVSAEVTR